jgi:membrane protein required for colicin V production
MLAVVIGCMVFGAWKGMAWQVASLASIVVSYFSAVKFSGALAPMISAEAPWNKAVAMLILYVATSIGVWLAFRLVAGFIDKVRLKEFDRQIGAMFGAAKGVLLCLVITFFALSLSETARGMVHASRAGYYMTWLLKESDPYLPPRVREVLGPYIDRLEDKLNPGSSPAGPQVPGVPQLPGSPAPGPLTPRPLPPGAAPPPPPRPFPSILSDSADGNSTASGNGWRPAAPRPGDGQPSGGLLELGSRIFGGLAGGNEQPSSAPSASRPASSGQPAPAPPPATDDWNTIFSRGLDAIRTLEEFGATPKPTTPRRR